ncbi:helix-turn-helix domain-containing protein [Shinella sp.]|uniref:helix-turn-helix domain-containing protein n=1 Tax=Shinella sp. TaxID=1870904 RepID=UPI0039E6D2DF
MELHPIRTDADYRAALKAAEAFFDAQDEPNPASKEGAYFDALITLIEAYEHKHHPVDPPDAIEAIKFRMEQAGLSVADMEPYIGPRHRVYEVLNGKRMLTLAMIRRLHDGLGIPAEALIGSADRLAIAA